MPILYNNRQVSKLTNAQVRELRRSRPTDPKARGNWYRAMAAKHNVHQRSIARICYGYGYRGAW